MTKNTLITNIGELVTLAPLAKDARTTQIQAEDLGIQKKAWLKIVDGKVHSFGSNTPPTDDCDVIDAEGGLVIPGLVDCHTHPVFGGSRSHEFAKRLDGATYQEIAAAGGGILSTVTETRRASLEDLKDIGSRHLKRFLANGVTTVEAKSGYGLTVEDELKLLRAIKALSEESPQTIISTCLALHAVPKETTKDAYISEMTKDLLPKVKEENLATYVDAFVEKGYFEVEDCNEHMRVAKDLGFKIRIHADEFADSRAGSAAAAWGAVSADHLEKASSESIAAMAQAGVTAVILPGTSLYCAMEYTDARPFIDAGCPVALATDFNPGSCRVDNLAFIATLGALHCHMNVATAVAGVTYVPAASLGLAAQKGHLDIGSDGDCLIYGYKSLADWIADLGQDKPRHVFIDGSRIQ